MLRIKYISLSDLHFGEEDSLLTNLVSGRDEVDPTSPSPVLKSLVNCLKAVVDEFGDPAQKPALILNGDILELALAEDEEAGMVFQRFLEGIMPPGSELFSRIFFLPGNHDHHLWEMAREAQYTGRLTRKSEDFQKKPLPRPWHTTKLFCEGEANPVRSSLLDALADSAGLSARPDIQIAYPNVGLETIYEKLEYIRKVKIPETIFVHGHTHKPFSNYQKFYNYPGWVDLYNTDGWVVETDKPSPLHGGAMVLVDEELNAAAIRLYNEENPNQDVKPPFVEEASREFRLSNPLHINLKSWLNPEAPPWKDLTDRIGKCARIRRTHLRGRILRNL